MVLLQPVYARNSDFDGIPTTSISKLGIQCSRNSVHVAHDIPSRAHIPLRTVRHRAHIFNHVIVMFSNLYSFRLVHDIVETTEKGRHRLSSVKCVKCLNLRGCTLIPGSKTHECGDCEEGYALAGISSGIKICKRSNPCEEG